ncbi:MAG: nucleotide exchange factor GrpE [Elusimicrobia bacterium]|nr:nucleotide exchange factor GrpE [Elusimicrobiota bacterium]
MAATRGRSPGLFDQLLRLKAEFENYRKRVEQGKDRRPALGQKEIVLRLVSLMDVMEQAEAVAPKSTDVKSIVLGLDMLYGEFKRLLKERGPGGSCRRGGRGLRPPDPRGGGDRRRGRLGKFWLSCRRGIGFRVGCSARRG